MEDDKELTQYFIEIKEDLATLKADTTHIKQEVSETKEVVKTQNGRISVLERWRARLTGALAVITALIGALAYFK